MDKLAKVKGILESKSTIDTNTYVNLINELPYGLTSKLRLVPDKYLGPKLAHLLVVAGIEASEENIGFEYEPISVEGIDDNTYLFDHDAIVKDKRTGKTVLIDCTSNPALAMQKSKVMQEQKLIHPVIDSYMVHIFVPKVFKISITRPDELAGENSNIFDLLDYISLRPVDWKNDFFEACSEIYEKVCSEVLIKDRADLNDRYTAWEDERVLVSTAVDLVRDHSDQDAIMFKRIAMGTKSRVYYDTYKKILKQQRPISPPVMHYPAALNSDKSLNEVLAALSVNPIAKCLALALRHSKSWVGINADGSEACPIFMNNLKEVKKLIPGSSTYKVIAKHIKGHIFEIKFDENNIDENFKEQVCSFLKTDKKADKLSEKPLKAFKQMNRRYEAYLKELTEPAMSLASNSILGKITTLASQYSKFSNAPVAKGSAMLLKTADTLNRKMIGDVVNHDYEVAKSVSASLKSTPRADYYYVGVNGPFCSVTLTRLSSTQDSFTTTSYFTIYQRSSVCEYSSVKGFFRVNGNVIQSKTRTFNRNSLAHALKFPFMFCSLLTWELENVVGESSTIVLKLVYRMIVNSFLHVSVNNDQFSQCAEQIRYLVTSNLGFGASASAICDKIDFIRPKTLWENVYLFRMLKLACALNVVYKNKSIGRIMENNEFTIAFPNSVVVVSSFSHMISSMYYANIYNKFRAFHEVSEAVCYNELNEEDAIYKSAILINKSFVQGISVESINLIETKGRFKMIEFIDNEVEFCRSLVNTGTGRFKFSISFVIGATLKTMVANKELISDIYAVLGSSPVDACTMHGSMESGPAKVEHQGIRAASAMFEELVEEMGFIPEEVNRSKMEATYFLTKIEERRFDFSIMSAVLRQFHYTNAYRYRIVQKDQKGHREISVLNAKFRLGALFCEKVAHELSSLVQSDVLDHPNKDIVVENTVRATLKDKAIHLMISDNSDQKRWGPNHLLHSFSAMFLAVLKHDVGLFRVLNLVLHYGENKMAKYPETLVDLGMKTGFVSRSEPISKFFAVSKKNVTEGKNETLFEWGMCQGIFHRTSSLYHGLMCNVVANVLSKVENIPKHTVQSFVTSDDAERLICFKEAVEDRVMLCKKVHSIINNVGSVMNILRNESKSVFSAHITEFNSIFYHRGILATPTLKQRISKIDIGDGNDFLLDYLTAVSLGMGYFQSGGSFMGTVIISLLNLSLHTEQWRRWKNLTDVKFNRPVEFGGFPVVNPFAVMYGGPISSFFLKSKFLANANIFAHIIAETVMAPAVEVTLADFDRTGVKSEEGMSIFKSAGPLGILSLTRTDKRLSQFERRHRMSTWPITEEFITLSKTSSKATHFIFNLMKITKSNEFETSLGINSFYLRFSDPWVNHERKCLKVHSNSLIAKHIFKIKETTVITPMEYETAMESVDDDGISSFYRSIKNEADVTRKHTVVNARLEYLMKDALAIDDNLWQIHDINFMKPDNRNSIIKVNFATDNSVDEKDFHLMLLKSVVGEPIRNAVIAHLGSDYKWESIRTIEGLGKMNALEGMYHCGNIIQLYNRFVRRSTKLVCPGEIKPSGIPQLLKMMMNCKFTEQYGIHSPSFPDMQFAKLPQFAFRECTHELIKRSMEFWSLKEKNIDIESDFMPAKSFVISEDKVITSADSFTLTDSIASRKTVLIHIRGKQNFMHRIRMWMCAHVDIRFSETTMNSLMKGDLTHFHEYCVNDELYLKNQTGLNYSVVNRSNGKPCLEMQNTVVTESGATYTHFFFVLGAGMFVNIDASLNEKHRPWAKRVVDYIGQGKRYKTNTLFCVSSSKRSATIEDKDYVCFVPVNQNDLFEIVTLPNNLTIFLKHKGSDVMIPVCSHNMSELQNANLNFKYLPSDFEEALDSFNPFHKQLIRDKDLPADDLEFIKFLLFRTSAFTPVALIRTYAAKKNINVRLTTLEACDIFRCMILSSIVKHVRGDRVRVQHYFLNLFRNAPFYNNGITSVKFKETLIDDVIANAEADVEMESETLDLNIPDAPAWMSNDARYMDEFSSAHPLEEVAENETDSDSSLDLGGFDFDALAGDTMKNLDIANLFDPAEETRIDAIEKPEINLFADLEQLIPMERNLAIDLGVEISDSHVINRYVEDCDRIVSQMRKIANAFKPTSMSFRVLSQPRSVVEMMSALCVACISDSSLAEEELSDMYSGFCPIFNFRMPISPVLLSELFFD